MSTVYEWHRFLFMYKTSSATPVVCEKPSLYFLHRLYFPKSEVSKHMLQMQLPPVLITFT